MVKGGYWDASALIDEMALAVFATLPLAEGTDLKDLMSCGIRSVAIVTGQLTKDVFLSIALSPEV